MKNYNDKCGSHIIYVNGRYEGNDDIGRMMKDFHQCRPEQIESETLSKAVAYYKEKEGRGAMSEAVRQYAMEYAKEYAKEYAVKEKMISVKNLMENMELTVDQALNALGIQGDERKTIINQLQNRN